MSRHLSLVLPFAALAVLAASRSDAQISPFPDRFSEPSAPLAKREAFNRAFDAAVASALQDPRSPGLVDLGDLPLTLVALDGDGARPLTGQRDFEMHYSGSLLKMAPMYAAFQLREVANQLAATLDVGIVDTQDKLFKEIGDTFDTQIDQSVERIRSANGVSREMRLPKYSTIFKAAVSNGKWKLEFNDTTPTPPDSFAVHLRDMIVGSSNASAGVCVRALGYSWINGLLQAAGFLDLSLTGREGIWLAGDYGAQPTVDVDSRNDKLVKQASTTFHMAWLLVMLCDRKLVSNTVDPATGLSGNDEMLKLLELAVDATGGESLLKHLTPPPPFTVTHSKIGVGQLKRDPNAPGTPGSCNTPIHGCVYSEAAILRHSSGRRFVAVFQNMLDGRFSDLQRIANLIQKVMDSYP